MPSELRNFLLASAAVAALTSNARGKTLVRAPFTSWGHQQRPSRRSLLCSPRPCQRLIDTEKRRSAAHIQLAYRPGEHGSTDNRVVLRFDTLGKTHTLHSAQYQTMSRLEKRKKQTERAAPRMMGGQS
jgi:hypothetical protein